MRRRNLEAPGAILRRHGTLLRRDGKSLPPMLYLSTESVSVYTVLREGVFVAESDGVFREEGVKGDSPVVRVGSNDDFLQISTCGQNPQTASIPAFLQRGHAWSPLRNPMVPSLILGLMHGLRADAWAASRSGSRRRSFMRATLPPPRSARSHPSSAESVPPRVA